MAYTSYNLKIKLQIFKLNDYRKPLYVNVTKEVNKKNSKLKMHSKDTI